MRLFVLVLAAATCFAADPALVRMLPANAKAVVGVDVSRTTASPIGQFILTKMQDDGGLQKLITQTGFDPRRDIREVLAANIGDQKHGLILLRGNFDVPRLVEHAKFSGASVSTYAGVNVITGTQPDAPWFALLDSNTAVGGEEGLVKAAIAQRNGTSQLDPELAAKVNDLSAKYDAWMVSTLPVGQYAGKAPNSQIGGAMRGNVMQAIEQTSGGIVLNADPIRIEAQALTRSAKDATALVDVINFLASMVQMNQDKAPEAARLAEVLNTLKLDTQANVVLGSVLVNEAQLEQWINNPPQHRQGARAKQAAAAAPAAQ